MADSSRQRLALIVVTRADFKPVGSAYVRLIQTYKVLENWDIICFDSRRLPGINEAEIAIVQRNALGDNGYEIIKWAEEWKQAGKKIIYEIDDNLLDYKALAPRIRRSVQSCKLTADISKYLMNVSDAVTVSTDALLSLAKKYNNTVYCMPNYIDKKLWRLENNKKKNKHDDSNAVVIGYVGTLTHSGDLNLVRQAINQIDGEYGERVRFEVIGGFDVDAEKFGEIISLPEINTYPEFVSWLLSVVDWDIALVPLEDIHFNHYKSHLKYLECTALEVACIGSNVIPYNEIIQDGVTGLLADNTTESWYENIKLLIDDPVRRKNMQEAAYQNLVGNHTIQVNKVVYQNILEEVLNNKKQAKYVSKYKSSLIQTKRIWVKSKKLRKLLNTPYQYFNDSTVSWLRPLRFLFKKT